MAKNRSPDPDRNQEQNLRRSLRESLNHGSQSRDEEPPAQDDWLAQAARETAGGAPHSSSEESHAHAEGAPPAGSLAQLEAENEELRSIIAELRQHLDDAAQNGQGSFEDRESQYEAMLEDKSEEIRGLYIKIKELEELAAEVRGPGQGRPGGGNSDEDAMREELENERMQVEEERQRVEEEVRQLREDEDDLMRRMREMELQMAKGRADLTRQHNELHQMHNEIRRELENAQQAGTFNERVRSLQQQHQEVANAPKRGGGGGGGGGLRNSMNRGRGNE
jgi:hypothetical protein